MTITVARVGDYVFCYCVCASGKCPDGVVISGDPKTIVENRPIARVGDLCNNCCFSCCACPNTIISGDTSTIVSNKPVAHIGSSVTCGVITSGATTTLT